MGMNTKKNGATRDVFCPAKHGEVAATNARPTVKVGLQYVQ